MSPFAHIRSHALASSATLALLTLFTQSSGCADLNDTGLSALATRVNAFAVVNGQLVQGEMTLYPDHTGTVALRAAVAQSTGDGVDLNAPAKPLQDPILNSCLGRFHYTASNYGAIDLRCNDGSASDLRMALIGETRGYGYGQTASGLTSLTFGMGPGEARAHLTVPPGKQLLETGSASGLEMR
jgi:hypothetical protein